MGIGVVQSCESALSYYYKAAKKGSVYVHVCMVYSKLYIMAGTKIKHTKIVGRFHVKFIARNILDVKYMRWNDDSSKFWLVLCIFQFVLWLELLSSTQYMHLLLN